ncbi:hypothetical protein [Kordia jejudonensis]|uniref:hypothetical protein n=1 Tax=Kordia jejudonensis TaxID=1348245 RepID=UPI0006293007|nr:hypothetical protein [Kordia jejudonensis]
MKKERKLKLVMNKMKISQLTVLYGGADPNTTVASAVLCATDNQTAPLNCNISQNGTCPDPTSGTGATKTNQSLQCIMSAQC